MNAKFLPSSASKGAAAGQGPAGGAAATVARPEPTDLLLCGHHYRVSRRALEAARAAVRNLPGISPGVAAWIDLTSITRLTAFAEG